MCLLVRHLQSQWQTSLMTLLGATQITAVATVVLAVGAIVSALFAFLAFRKQAEEVRSQRIEIQRNAWDRRRAQAAQIFLKIIWDQPPSKVPAEANQPRADPMTWRFIATIHNLSNLPIYDIGAFWKIGGTIFGRRHGTQAVLAPSDSSESTFIHTYDKLTLGRGAFTESELAEVTFSFRDAAGVRWQTNAKGNLIEEPLSDRPALWGVRAYTHRTLPRQTANRWATAGYTPRRVRAILSSHRHTCQAAPLNRQQGRAGSLQPAGCLWPERGGNRRHRAAARR